MHFQLLFLGFTASALAGNAFLPHHSLSLSSRAIGVTPRQSCPGSQVACGDGCMPSGGECCDESVGQYCEAGDTCGSLGCCPDGETCTGPPSGCDDGQVLCGPGCIPEGGECCDEEDGSWCDAGTTCSSSIFCEEGSSGSDSSDDSSDVDGVGAMTSVNVVGLGSVFGLMAMMV